VYQGGLNALCGLRRGARHVSASGGQAGVVSARAHPVDGGLQPCYRPGRPCASKRPRTRRSSSRQARRVRRGWGSRTHNSRGSCARLRGCGDRRHDRRFVRGKAGASGEVHGVSSK
jgi:hypothetical protein